ncbi:MAG TPA: CPXCG motif-containing cysteine-rich protein [Planctomycetota bacterium]|nr:CPXCG motif-containing cysteine-rich protein [Planctomycetota bacterium]
MREADVLCPYCGEPGAVDLDGVEEDDVFTQDCGVCCRPWTVRVRVDRDGRVDVSVTAEGD